MRKGFSIRSRDRKARLAPGRCLAALVFAIVLCSLVFYHTKSNLAKETEEQIGMISGSIAETVDGAVASESAAIAMLARKEAVIRAVKERNAGSPGPKADLLQKELNGIQPLTEGRYEAIVVAGRDGVVLADNVEGAARGSIVKAREPFRTAMQGKASLDKAVTSERTGTPVCILSHPVRDENGRVIGAVAGEMKVSFLAAAIDGIRLGRTGHAFVVDHEGTAFVRPGSGRILSRNLADEPGMEAVIRRTAAGERGVLTYMHRGVPMYAGFVPVKTNGWSVLATVPADEMPYAFNAAGDVVGIGATLFALFAAAAAYFSVRSNTAAVRAREAPGMAYDWILPVSGEQTMRINATVGEGYDAAVRHHAANAEESSSSAQEMRAQAMHISGFVGDLVSLVAGGSGRRPRISLRAVGGKAASEPATRPSGGGKKRSGKGTGAGAVKVVPLKDGLRNS